MAGNSKIEWTGSTWNPVVGCSIVSPGCTNCYAMHMAHRLELMGQERYAGTTKVVNGKSVWTGAIRKAPVSTLLEPLRRKKPTTYFVNSMSDLFHEDVQSEWIEEIFAVMALSPRHTFQILTKRGDRMRNFCNWQNTPSRVTWKIFDLAKAEGIDLRVTKPYLFYSGGEATVPVAWPLPNVWLGVSAERQQEADERVPLLLDTPAAVRFVSAEPLLGRIAFHALNLASDSPSDALTGARCVPDDSPEGFHNEYGPKLDWIIVGGESGPGARPMHPDWARLIRDWCKARDVAFFFKQHGAWSEFYDRDRDDPDWRNPPKCDGQMGGGATRYHNLAGGTGFHGERVVAMRNVGKAKAGRLLDGVEHNELPKEA